MYQLLRLGASGQKDGGGFDHGLVRGAEVNVETLRTSGSNRELRLSTWKAIRSPVLVLDVRASISVVSAFANVVNVSAAYIVRVEDEVRYACVDKTRPPENARVIASVLLNLRVRVDVNAFRVKLGL